MEKLDLRRTLSNNRNRQSIGSYSKSPNVKRKLSYQKSQRVNSRDSNDRNSVGY